MTVEAGTILGGYRIERLIGAGGMAEVYRARQLSLDRLVALKLIGAPHAADAVFAARFKQEARAVAALEHPHIVPVYDSGEAAGRLFLSMRLIEGENLSNAIARAGALPPAIVVGLLEQVASALDHAHAAGILHRDVKPANVLLAQTGGGWHAYLADFGIAKRVDGSRITGPGIALGTPAYLAPEVIRGEPSGPEADVYALGCVAWEALTGTSPFGREDPLAAMAAHLSVVPPAPSSLAAGIPPALDEALMRALAKRPHERFSAASELAAACRAALDGRGGRATTAAARPAALIGRTREIAAVSALVRDPQIRIVTLTGPGGMGKTALAKAVAERVGPQYADGAVQVLLESLSSADAVLPAIAEQVGLRSEADRPLLTSLADAFARRDALVLLDNFEHVQEAAADVAALAASGSAITFLVTSRAPLRVAGERLFEVPPLSLPDPAARVDADSFLAGSEAARLFVARAREATQDALPLSPSACEVIGDICRKLDGMPLALELAAARTRHLSLRDLARRLDNRLELLDRGRRDMPARHRTVRAAIGASEELLDPGHRTVFARLGVFVGGFALDAVEAICDGDLDVVDAVGALVDISLVRHEIGDGHSRYTMLEVVHEYAAELLDTSPDADAVRARHTDHYVELAEQLGPRLRFGAGDPDAAQRLLEERANFLVALRRLDATGDGPRLLRAATALGPIWLPRLYGQEALRLADRALALGGDADPVMRAGGLSLRAGALIRAKGSYANEEARGCLEEAARLCTAEAAPALRFQILCGLGVADAVAGDPEAAERWCFEALAVADALDDNGRRATALSNLTDVALLRGDWDAALDYGRTSVQLADRVADRSSRGAARINLAIVLLKVRETDEAAEALRCGLEHAIAAGDTEMLSEVLLVTAALAAACGQYERAGRLLGGAERMREELGLSFQPSERQVASETRHELSLRRGEEASARAIEAGRQLVDAELLELAGEVTGGHGAPVSEDALATQPDHTPPVPPAAPS